MNTFYVYVHKRLSDGNIFYVGKGKGNRAFDRSGRNNLWQKIVDKHGLVVEIIHANLLEQTAWDIETRLIEQYGRLCDNTGVLANLSTGGEGAAGVTHSPETKQKWSVAKKGKKRNLTDEQREAISNWLRARTVTAETRQKMSAARKARKSEPKVTDETRKKLSEMRKGRPSPTKGMTLSAEARQNMSAAATIRGQDPEIRARISNSMKGRPKSEETKLKMKEAAARRAADPEYRKKCSESAKNRKSKKD